MIITNKLGLSESLVSAVTPDAPHNAEGCISATTLLRGAKEILLTQRHWDNIESDASNRLFAAFGTAVHKVFEDEDDKPGIIKEQQFSKKVGKYTITGKLDRFDPEEKTIFDYKSTSIYKVKGGNFEEWYTQLMIYAWLLKDAGYEVNKLCIYALLRDWSRTEAKRDPKYPQTQAVVIPFDIGEDDFKFIDKYISDKVAEIEAAEPLADDDIPACSSKERWEKPAKYAAMVEGGKKALKLFDSEPEAKTYIQALSADPKNAKKKYSLEFRPGQSVKCMDYCDCCYKCNFYKNNVESMEA